MRQRTIELCEQFRELSSPPDFSQSNHVTNAYFPVGRRPIGLQPTSPEAHLFSPIPWLELSQIQPIQPIQPLNSLWTEETEETEETEGLYFKRLEYFNFGSLLHNVLIFNISRTPGAPVPQWRPSAPVGGFWLADSEGADIW